MPSIKHLLVVVGAKVHVTSLSCGVPRRHLRLGVEATVDGGDVGAGRGVQVTLRLALCVWLRWADCLLNVLVSLHGHIDGGVLEDVLFGALWDVVSGLHDFVSERVIVGNQRLPHGFSLA